jgi:hypothetical protein
MGASREGRKSEQTLNEVWNGLRQLTVECWIPRADDAEETVAFIKRKLDQVVAEMKAEAFTTPPANLYPNTFGLVDTPKRP